MQLKRGFTLVELMVSVSIFVIVALVAVGALITANRVNQRAQATKLIMDNLNFALDSMTLKMRKGVNFYCDRRGRDDAFPAEGDSRMCQTGGSRLVFSVPSDNRRYAYSFDEDEGGNRKIWVKIDDGEDAVPITADAITLDSQATFRVISYNGPAMVVMDLEGTGRVAHDAVDFALQTLVAERQQSSRQ